MKQIPGFPQYSITTDGRVWSHRKERWLSPYTQKNGYVGIHLTHNKIVSNQYIHRLVGLTYIPNPENKPEINHKNGVLDDNSVNNLEWVTKSEQHIHRVEVLHKSTGTKNGSAKLTSQIVFEIRRDYIPRKNSLSMLAKKYDVSTTQVYRAFAKQHSKFGDLF